MYILMYIWSFLNLLLDLLILIVTIIGYFLSSGGSDVGLDVFKTVIGSFKYLIITMMYSGSWNYHRMYSFFLLLNVLYWSLASLCSSAVPNTTPKLSTSTLKLLIHDVYTGRLKRPPRPPCPWWPPLLEQPHLLHNWPPLLSIDSLIVPEAWVIVTTLTSPPFLTTAVEAISIYGFIVYYFTFWIMLSIKSYTCSTWNITPHVCSRRTRQWCS